MFSGFERAITIHAYAIWRQHGTIALRGLPLRAGGRMEAPKHMAINRLALLIALGGAVSNHIDLDWKNIHGEFGGYCG